MESKEEALKIPFKTVEYDFFCLLQKKEVWR